MRRPLTRPKETLMIRSYATKMPSFAFLGEESVDALVSYIRSLTPSADIAGSAEGKGDRE